MSQCSPSLTTVAAAGKCLEEVLKLSCAASARYRDELESERRCKPKIHQRVSIQFNTFQNFFAPSRGDAIVVWCSDRVSVVQADWSDVRIVFDVVLQVKNCDIMIEAVGLELRMEDDSLNANNLERFWLFITSQSPFSGLDQNVVVSMAVN